MKKVFIVGFGSQLKKMLDDNFLAQSECGNIVWVSEGTTAADVAKFRERFTSTLTSHALSDVVVLFAIAPTQRWADSAVDAIVGQARNRFVSIRIALDIYRDFGAINQVRARVDAVGLASPSALTVEQVREKLKGGKVYCVVAAGKTSILGSLARAGVPQLSIDENFIEEVIPTGMNSTLMATLERNARSYGHMLYAWNGLRTSSKGLINIIKKKGGFFLRQMVQQNSQR